MKIALQSLLPPFGLGQGCSVSDAHARTEHAPPNCGPKITRRESGASSTEFGHVASLGTGAARPVICDFAAADTGAGVLAWLLHDVDTCSYCSALQAGKLRRDLCGLCAGPHDPCGDRRCDLDDPGGRRIDHRGLRADHDHGPRADNGGPRIDHCDPRVDHRGPHVDYRGLGNDIGGVRVDPRGSDGPIDSAGRPAEEEQARRHAEATPVFLEYLIPQTDDKVYCPEVVPKVPQVSINDSWDKEAVLKQSDLHAATRVALSASGDSLVLDHACTEQVRE